MTTLYTDLVKHPKEFFLFEKFIQPRFLSLISELNLGRSYSIVRIKLVYSVWLLLAFTSDKV